MSANEPKWQTQIKTWLAQEGFQLAQASNVQDAQWAYTWKDANGYEYYVSQSRKSPDQFLIQSAALLDDSMRAGFLKMSRDERRSFLWHLRVALLNIGVDYNGIAEPLEFVAVVQAIYEDGLTKDAFLQRLAQVRRAITLAVGMVVRRFE